ncbi:putative juvenile hormone acid methyltransferase activity protein [Trypoxylus dichotomus]
MNEASLYSQNNILQRHDALFVLKRYAKLIKWKYDVEETILDVGCADGNVTVDILLPFLPENVENIVGVDISKEMIEFAKKKYYSNERITFIQGDIGSKKTLEEFEAYDHIFSFFCLHWIQNQRKCVENLYNLLKPKGDMLLTFLVTNPIYDIYEKLSKYQIWEEYMMDVNTFISPFHYSKDPEAAYIRLLKEAGFNVGMCKIIDRIFIFTDVILWRKAVASVNPFLSRIPDSLKKDFQQDFFEEVKRINCVIKNENNNEDNIEVRYKLFVVYAHK